MRILHVSQPTDGGTARVVTALARAAVSQGHAVSVACPDGDLARDIAGAGAAWIPLSLRRSPHPVDVLHVRKVRRLFEVADVVHLHSSKAGAVGRSALALVRKPRRPPCEFTPHGWSWYVGGRLAPVYRGWERVAARYSDVISVVSPSELRDGRALLRPRDADRLIEIPNGIDDNEFSPSKPPAPRGSAPLIVCVGRLAPQKGQDLLIRAMTRLTTPGATLRLVGAGPDKSELEALVRSSGLTKRVEFIGAAEPGPHYRAADVVVIPSRWEGHPLVLLEAMASGAAIVATPAVIGDTAEAPPVRTAEPTDESLAAAIDAVLMAPALRSSLGAESREYVATHWSMARNIERHMSVLQELTGITANQGGRDDV
jgi:glycosyltransferase involved in cell wall biosynthesis